MAPIYTAVLLFFSLWRGISFRFEMIAAAYVWAHTPPAGDANIKGLGGQRGVERISPLRRAPQPLRSLCLVAFTNDLVPSRSAMSTTATLEMHTVFQGLTRALTNARRLYGSLTLRHSPIHRLPHELLSLIFLMATHDSYDPYEATRSPVQITHVCSRWRQIALSTGGLWTNIILTFPVSTRQLNRTVPWLGRSKASPLNILLDFRDPSWDWEENTHGFSWQDMEVVLRLLLPHVTRWRRFELLTDTWAPIFTFLWYTRRIVSAPKLERLSLSRCNAFFAARGESFQPVSLKQPLPLFGGFAPENLREVSLVGVHVDWSKSALRNLVKLEMKYHARDVMPTITQFIDIIAACPDLRELSIMGWGPQIDTEDTAGEDHVNLTRLRQSIKLQYLTRLSFGFVDTDYGIELLSLFYLPALRELVLEDVMAGLDPTTLQDASPLLGWLVHNHTSHCPSPAHGPADHAPRPFPLARLTSLELSGIRSSEMAFAHLFRECTTLRQLRLLDTNPDVLRALTPHDASTHPTDCGSTCPALSELSCRGMDLGVLADTVTARAEAASVASIDRVYLKSSGAGASHRPAPADLAKLRKAGAQLFIESPCGARVDPGVR